MSVWTPGAWRQGCMYFHRSPHEPGKVPYTMTPATRGQAEAIIGLFELTGRQPLSVGLIRKALADPRALLGG